MKSVNIFEINCTISFWKNFQVVVRWWITYFGGKYCSNFIGGRQIKSIFCFGHVYFVIQRVGIFLLQKGLPSCCSTSISVFSTSAVILYFYVNGFISSIILCNMDMRLYSHVKFLELRRSFSSVVSIM